MAPQFVKKLQRKQIEIMEEEEEEIKAVLKVEEKRQAQQKKHFDEWTEESKNFIVSYTIRVVTIIHSMMTHTFKNL